MVGREPVTETAAGQERRLLGRFYAAAFLLEASHLAMPFKVLLAASTLGTAGLCAVLAAERLATVLLEIPTGAWADRYGRRPCVLGGFALEAVGWLLVPIAATAVEARLAAMVVAFALIGAGTALASGAHEAWVVDNLGAAGRPDLVGPFFARERALASLGGLVADVAAWIGVAACGVPALALATGIGQLAALAILRGAPELARPARDGGGPVAASTTADVMGDVVRTLAYRPALRGFTLAWLWLGVALGVMPEAFQAALVRADLDPQGFALLQLCVDAVGALAPLGAIGVARRRGGTLVMAAAVVAMALAGVLAVVAGSPWTLVPLYLAAMGSRSILLAAGDERRHALLIPSIRASASSVLNMADALSHLASTALFAALVARLPTTSALGVMGLLALPAVGLLVRHSRDEVRPVEPPCPAGEGC